MIGRAQAFAMPLQEGRRAAAQIDGDVEDLAAEAGDDLRFGVRRPLEVQPANGPGRRRQRVVHLSDPAAFQPRGELIVAEEALQIAPRIADREALQDVDAGECRWFQRQPVRHVTRAAS